MKKNLLALSSLVSAVTLNLDAAKAESLTLNPEITTPAVSHRSDYLNRQVNRILIEAASSREEQSRLRSNPAEYFRSKGIEPMAMNKIFHLDNSGNVVAKTGVTGCRPYTYTPISAGKVPPVGPYETKLNEQNIRMLEWYQRN